MFWTREREQEPVGCCPRCGAMLVPMWDALHRQRVYVCPNAQAQADGLLTIKRCGRSVAYTEAWTRHAARVAGEGVDGRRQGA